MRRGYIQVYTGCGKGKTTAALGLALRAAGAGLKIFIAQFIKKKRCSEHAMLEHFRDRITLKQYGKGFFLKRKPTNADIQAAQDGYREIREILISKDYDVVILDEANVATRYGLFSVDDLLALMAAKPNGVELVITGRYADERVIAGADLVTEMTEVKHYKGIGVKARVGIEK
jgi:cob(I)alamin adenosyltransferase